MSESLPVLVTGVGGGGHGAQILKALRLAHTPYWVAGTDVSPYSSGLALVDQPYLVPRADDPGYVDAILKICRAHAIRAVFHGSEPELKVLSANRGRLEAEGVFVPINPQHVIDVCMDKLQTAERLRELGFGVPPFAEVQSLEDAQAFGHFPAVLKPAVGGGGSANLFLVQTPEELTSCVEQLLAICDRFIMQAYVGTHDQEYTVGVLLDMHGNLINSIGVRRYVLSALGNRVKAPNRSGREELGPLLAISSGVSQGEIGRFPQVTRTCEAIALGLGARGPLNVQCRLVDGQVSVFEINPRFSGTTSLRALAGYNEPDVLIRTHVLGETIEPRFDYREGTILRSLTETFVDRLDFPRAADLP